MSKPNISGPPASASLGSKPINIAGPYHECFVPRVSVDGEFTQGDRTWRARWLKDQHLSPKDGERALQNRWDIAEFNKQRLNIFRRIHRAPMDAFEKVLRGAGVSFANAHKYRLFTTITARLWVACVGITYYGLYHGNNWERSVGVKVYRTKDMIDPDHPEWPHNTSQERTRPDQYGNFNFNKSRI